VLKHATIIFFQPSGTLPLLRLPHGLCLARIPLILILPALAFAYTLIGYLVAYFPTSGLSRTIIQGARLLGFACNGQAQPV